MGTVVLADVTELDTIKISELDAVSSADEDNIVPVVKDSQTKKITKANFLRFLEAEYQELSSWLDDVTLGSDGLTTVPEVVLNPRASALSDVVGGVYYSNVDNSIYVCVSI